MSTNTTTEFSHWLKSSTPADVYMDLSELTGINKPRLTRLIKRPSSASADEVRKLAKVLGLSPLRLIADHGMGFAAITLGQVDAIWAEASEEDREAYLQAVFQPVNA